MWYECVISAVTAIVSVCIAEYFVRKREIKDKKMQIQMEYLKAYAKELCSIEEQLLEISRNIDNCLAQDNPEKRSELYPNISKQLSRFNQKNLVTMLSINYFVEAMKMNWSIVDHKKYIGQCSHILRNILDEYITKPDTSEATALINKCMDDGRKQISIEMKIVMETLVELVR